MCTNHYTKMASVEFRDIVTKCYALYFGSPYHIGVRWCSRCSYHVIMCGGPFGDAPSIGVLCSVYKAKCCWSSGLGKKEMSLRHRRTKATHNRISITIHFYERLMVGIMFPTPKSLQSDHYDPCIVSYYITLEIKFY